LTVPRSNNFEWLITCRDDLSLATAEFAAEAVSHAFLLHQREKMAAVSNRDFNILGNSQPFALTAVPFYDGFRQRVHSAFPRVPMSLPILHFESGLCFQITNVANEV